MGVRSQNEKSIQDYLKKNPQYQNIVKYDPVSDAYSFNLVKDIDLNKAYDSSIRDNESQMTQMKFLRKSDNNTDLYELSLAPEQLASIASSYGTNPEYVNNLKIKESAKFQQYLAQAAQELPELPANQLESIAAAKIAEENLQSRNKKAHFETKAQPIIINNGGGYNVAGKSFNPSLAPASQYVDAYVASGVITQEQANLYKTALKTNPDIANNALSNVPDILAIDPPNTGTFTIKDQNGKTFKADNLKAIYVPETANGKGDQWFMAGSRVDKGVTTPVLVPINENTYGNLISVYGKMTTSDIEKLLNRRMEDGGVTNKTFKLNVMKPTQGARSQKTTSVSAIKKLVGTKGYEDYTEKELIDYYRSQGYEIKK